MKKTFKKLSLIAASIFSFLFVFFGILFSSNEVKAYDGRLSYTDYNIYELTVPGVKIYEYDFNSIDKTITVNENSVYEVDLKFPFMSTDTMSDLKYTFSSSFSFRTGDFVLQGFHEQSDGTYTLQQDINVIDQWWEVYSKISTLYDYGHRTVDNEFDNEDNYDLADYIFINYDDNIHGTYKCGYHYHLINTDELYASMTAVKNSVETYIVNVSLNYKETDNQDVIDNYINDNNYHSDQEYLEYGESKYQEGFEEGEASVDITSDNEEVYNQGYNAGVGSVDITTDNQQAINDYIFENNMKTESEYNDYGAVNYQTGYSTGYEKGHEAGYQEGVDSIDIETIKTQEYEKGYNVGYEEGVNSVDITTDNSIAINNYIVENNLKTETEYNAYGERRYQAGVASVDVNAAIENYLTENVLYKEDEYIAYGNQRYNEGANSVDIMVDNEYAINKYIYDNGLKTRSEYESYGEYKYQEGVDSVDITSDNAQIIEDFIKNGNYYTSQQYIDYGNSEYFRGYTAGAESVDTESYRLLGYEQGYKDGEANVDITIDNQNAINSYISEHKYHTDGEYIAHGNNQYNKGYEDGVNSVYTNIEEDNVVKEYVVNYIKVNKYYTSTQYIDNYDKGYNDGYTIGYSDGSLLSGLDEIKAAEYQRGYNDGYEVGYADGEYSVDVTVDNDTAIDIYITKNNYHPHWEFEMNFDLGFDAGTRFVYNNLHADLVIQEHVHNYITEHNYYTQTQFIDNYDLGYKNGYDKGYSKGYDDGYDLGESNVDKVITNEILVETMREKLLKGLTINLIRKGSDINWLIKNYDLDIKDNGDTKITIHFGQENYEIKTEIIEEVVPGPSLPGETTQDNSSNKYIVILFAALIIAIVIIIIIIFVWMIKKIKKSISYSSKKNRFIKKR